MKLIRESTQSRLNRFFDRSDVDGDSGREADASTITTLEAIAEAGSSVDQESLLWMAKLQHGMCVEEIESLDQLVDVLKMEIM